MPRKIQEPVPMVYTMSVLRATSESKQIGIKLRTGVNCALHGPDCNIRSPWCTKER